MGQDGEGLGAIAYGEDTALFLEGSALRRYPNPKEL